MKLVFLLTAAGICSAAFDPNGNAPFAANQFQCLDETRFKHFLSSDPNNFVVNSCPPGLCQTRKPRIKNPCIGAERAAQIDGFQIPNGAQPPPALPSSNPTAFDPNGNAPFAANQFQCIDNTRFKHFLSSDPNDFVVNSCPPGLCQTRKPRFKNPCIGAEKAAQIDGFQIPNGAQPPPALPSSNPTAFDPNGSAPFAANQFQCVDDTRFKHFISSDPNNFVFGNCPPGFCQTRKPRNKNPCIGAERAAQIDGFRLP
jgi:hypothetical protein